MKKERTDLVHFVHVVHIVSLPQVERDLSDKENGKLELKVCFQVFFIVEKNPLNKSNKGREKIKINTYNVPLRFHWSS